MTGDGIMMSWLFSKGPSTLYEKEMASDVMYILIYFCDKNASVERWGDVM